MPRRLSRSDDGRLITGVCAGLARYTRIDAVVFRVGFALLVIATGVGVALYIGAFLLMAATDGGPSKFERMRHRLLDGDTVLALLGAGMACGVLFAVIGNWASGNGLAVVVVFGLTMLVARSRGVDLFALARSMPERVKGRPMSSWTPPAPAPRPSVIHPSEGMVDLGRLGRPEPPPYGLDDVDDRRPITPQPRPYEPKPYEPKPYVARPRRRSYLTPVTLVIALVTAGVLFGVTGGHQEFARIQIVLGGTLCAIAAGLFLGAWFGRDRLLMTLGALMSLALATTSIAGDPGIARSMQHALWRPAGVTEADQTHSFLIGEGIVDLTTVPLQPGQRLQVNAKIALGVLKLRVPSTARVEVDGQAVIGDITVDRHVTSGPGARVRQVLEPETRNGKPAPTIALRIRSKVGDMEVTRVPA